MSTYGTRRRNTRTDLALVESGAWAKVGSKHFRHESGIEVKYDHNAWNWQIIGGRECGYRYGTLEVAAYSAVRGI